jgi:hypothetical protein
MGEAQAFVNEDLLPHGVKVEHIQVIREAHYGLTIILYFAEMNMGSDG